MGSRWCLGAVSVVAISTRLGRPLIVLALGVPLTGPLTKIRHGFWLAAIRSPLARQGLRAPPELP